MNRAIETVCFVILAFSAVTQVDKPQEIVVKPALLIALTFDDGPNLKITPMILDALKEQGIKATFFVVGEAAVKHPELMVRLNAEGYEIGNHTWSHRQLVKLDVKSVADEIEKTNQVIIKYGNVFLFRPSYGDYNATVKKTADGLKLQTVTWTLDSHDYRGFSPAYLARGVVAMAEANDIVLFYDVHLNTAQALPAIISDLKQRGFKFVTVSELLATGNKLAKDKEVN